MYTYCKYEFKDQAEWLSYKEMIAEGEANAMVELGSLCLEQGPDGECVKPSNMFAVDIIWNGEPSEALTTKEVFPNPIGQHTFAGAESLYTERFCQFNSGSPYCEVI